MQREGAIAAIQTEDIWESRSKRKTLNVSFRYLGERFRGGKDSEEVRSDA